MTWWMWASIGAVGFVSAFFLWCLSGALAVRILLAVDVLEKDPQFTDELAWSPEERAQFAMAFGPLVLTVVVILLGATLLFKAFIFATRPILRITKIV